MRTKEQRESKFPFELEQAVNVFSTTDYGRLACGKVSEKKTYKLVGKDADGAMWEVTWLSETNQQLYKWSAQGRKLVARYVRVVAVDPEVN